MPRPTPIIIPGNSGMGGSFKRTETNLQLDKIAALVDLFRQRGIESQQRQIESEQRQAAEQSGLAGLKMLGLTGERPPTAVDETGQTVPAAGPPTPFGQEFAPLAKSPEGQKSILKMLENRISPKSIDFSTTTIQKNGPEGKKHYYSMDPKTGMFTVDQGEIPPQEYKVMRAIGRGGTSGRPIVQDPNSGVMLYQDSMSKGTHEEVPAEDAQFLRPITVRGISDQQAVDLANLKDTYNRLGDISNKAEKMKDKFGPVSGRFTKLKQKFMEDGPTQEVMNELKSLITIAYGLSGKQISEKEMVMLQDAILPTMNQPYLNFASTLGFARDWVANTHDNRIDSFKNAFFDVKEPYLKGKEARGKYGSQKNQSTSGRFTIKEVK